MKDEGVEAPVRWTLDQLKTRFPAMVKQAGYEEIAEEIDQQAIADQLSRLEPEISPNTDCCSAAAVSRHNSSA
jgi:hypothetical protein